MLLPDMLERDCTDTGNEIESSRLSYMETHMP